MAAFLNERKYCTQCSSAVITFIAVAVIRAAAVCRSRSITVPVPTNPKIHTVRSVVMRPELGDVYIGMMGCVPVGSMVTSVPAAPASAASFPHA